MMENNFGPMVKAARRSATAGRRPAPSSSSSRSGSTAPTDGSMDVAGEYLIVMARKP